MSKTDDTGGPERELSGAGPTSRAPTRISGASDEELLRGAQAGDPAAFGELYDRHANLAWRVARAVCNDPNRAEDAVQEGFLSAWRSRESYRLERGSVRGWILAVVRNRAVDSVRREFAVQRPRIADGEFDGPDPAGGSVEEEVIARSEADSLRARLERLPVVQAEVITLAYYGELSYSEIAATLSLPPGTVKGRMRLGLKKLREQFEDAGQGVQERAVV